MFYLYVKYEPSHRSPSVTPRQEVSSVLIECESREVVESSLNTVYELAHRIVEAKVIKGEMVQIDKEETIEEVVVKNIINTKYKLKDNHGTK